MKTRSPVFIISLILAGGLALFVFGANGVKAGTIDEHNVSGYAWSENIGWIKFNNCTDPNTMEINPAACSGANYGIHINVETGEITGYAWSENIGWIAFGLERSATLDVRTGVVTGWARACAGAANANCTGGANPAAGGWDGWITLDGGTADLSVDVSGDVPYAFNGWASSSADPDTGIIGWISFSGANYGVLLNEPVIVRPWVEDMNVVPAGYCTAPYHAFSWTYRGDANETQFQFQIDNDANFISPTVDRTVSSLNNPNGTRNNQTVQVVIIPGADQLSYNTRYYWRVKVWDADGEESDWIVAPNYFDTEDHLYPNVESLGSDAFSWSPAEPAAEEEVAFINNANCYDIGNNPIDCIDAGGGWSWEFTPDGDPRTSFDRNPEGIVFAVVGPKTVMLTGTDDLGNSCSVTLNLETSLKLPDWREITPF